MDERWTCPVCGYPGLPEPPRSPEGYASYEICPSCGFQFGVDDDDKHETYESWRERWLAAGARWWSSSPAPAGWDGRAQLEAHLREDERGQTAAEYMGVLLLVAMVVAALFSSGLGPRISRTLAHEVACIGAGGCAAQASTGGSHPGGGANAPGTGSVVPGEGDDPAESALARQVREAAELGQNAPDNGWGRPETLQDHFDRHGGDFDSASPEEYAQQARDFLQRAVEEHLPTKVTPDGTIRVYDPETNEFGSYNPDGTTRTYFKPTRGPDYWDDQPGEDPYGGDEPGGRPGGGDEEPPAEEPPAEPAEPEVPDVPEVPEVPEIPEIPIPEIPIIP